MDTSGRKDAEHWAQEIERLHARIADFEARFEAECRILRHAVDTQVEELRAAVRKVEGEIATVGPDAYVERIAAQVAELKHKGDLAYELLQTRLRAGIPEDATTSTSNVEPSP